MPVTLGQYESFIENVYQLTRKKQSSYVCVLNVHMLMEGYRNQNFKNVITNADVITPDGMPVTWGLRFLHGVRQDRVAGMFLMQDLLAKAEKNNTSVFFYGSTPEVLLATETYLRKKYPNLKIGGFISPPFRVLSKEEDEEHVRQINASGAKLVFVALGCPKQEKWMARMSGRINAVMIGIGAALPVMVGLRRKAPAWIQNFGFEWLFRLCLEPRRLFRRYAVTNSLFVFLLTKEFVKIRFLGKQEDHTSNDERGGINVIKRANKTNLLSKD